MGIVALGAVRSFKEATPGTPNTSTAIWMGQYTAEWGEEVVVEQPNFQDGNISAGQEAVINGRMATLTKRGALTFEDFVFPLSAGIKAGVTGGAGDGGTPAMYAWAFAPTLTGTMDTLQTYTLECGDDVLIEEMSYAFCRDFSISAQIQQITEITENWVGRQLTSASFSGSLSNRTVNLVAGQKWVPYIDATGGTIGTTAYAGCFRGFTFNSGPLAAPFHCLNGNLYFDTYKRQELKPELRLTLTVDSSLAALRTAWRAGTRQLIRLRNIGGIIHDAVTYRVDIEMSGHITSMGPIGGQSEEGVYTEEVVITGAYDPTWGATMKFALQNAVATIP